MSDDPYSPVKPGDILADKHVVERVIGTGAMGVVVAAMHVDLQERRAIKFMLPSALANAEAVERFLREARAAVRLKSPHVAKIYDISRLANGSPYMVMEYLEGHDIKHVLDQMGPMPVHLAVGYMLQVCEAIAEAHSLGIVHRDLKPANLFLATGPGGVPCIKVLDFGIAKVIGDQAGLDMTQTSALLGTPLYMSPEQMRASKAVDGRSDIWALGAILYKMLTGQTPFSGSSVTEICAAVVADPPQPPAMLRAEIPPALEAAVMKCLEKNPAQRFATALDLAAAIRPFAAQPPRPAAQRNSQAGWNNPLAGTAILDPNSSYASPSAPQGASSHATSPGAASLRGATTGGGGAAPAPINYGASALPAATAAQPAQPTPQPPAILAATAPGNATGAAWMQPGAAVAPTPKRSSGKGALFAVVGLALVGGGVVIATRFTSSGAGGEASKPPPITPAADSSAPAPTAPPSASAAPTVSPAASATATTPREAPRPESSAATDAAPSATADAAVAAPAATATAPRPTPGQAGRWVRPPAPPPRPAPALPPPRPAGDAFGGDRK